MGLPMTENKLRNTWASINKGLALVLVMIPISLLMFVLYYEPPIQTISVTSCYPECHTWEEPTRVELTSDFYWQFIRLEITFTVILGLSLIMYWWRYDIF